MRELREGGDIVDVSPMTIFPEPGEAKEVAKLLLELADHPNQVMTTLDPGLGFKVPWWLYENFVTVWDSRFAPIASADSEGVEVQESSTEVLAEPGMDVSEPKRKPGRPRKEVK